MEKSAELHVLRNKAIQIVEYEMKMPYRELKKEKWHPTYLPVLEPKREFKLRNERAVGKDHAH